MEIQATIELLSDATLDVLEDHERWIRETDYGSYLCPNLPLSRVRPMLQYLAEVCDVSSVVIWYIVDGEYPEQNEPKLYEKNGVKFWNCEYCVLETLEKGRGHWTFDKLTQLPFGR